LSALRRYAFETNRCDSCADGYLPGNPISESTRHRFGTGNEHHKSKEK
jgi:hypothetical protein